MNKVMDWAWVVIYISIGIVIGTAIAEIIKVCLK